MLPKVLIAGALILVIIFIGWGFKTNFKYTNYSDDKVTQEYSGPIDILRIGNVGEYTIFNLIAKEKGYFRDNGLDVEIKEYTSGPASIEGLLKGETDINVAADFVGVRNIFGHPELRILAQVNQHRVFSVAFSEDSGIKDPVDLKGKKIAVTKNSAGEYFLGNFLNDNNLTLEDVTMIDLPPADMITQVEEGKIDAMVVFEPNVFKLKKKLGENFISWDVQGDQNISALAFTTKTYLENNPLVVERYLQTLVEAEEYYLSHQEEVKVFIAQKLGYEKEYIDYSWPKFTHSIALNQELILNMESEAAWVIKNGLTTHKDVPNYLEFMHFTSLEKIKPAAVTLTR